MKDMDSNVLGGPRTWTGRFPRERFHPPGEVPPESQSPGEVPRERFPGEVPPESQSGRGSTRITEPGGAPRERFRERFHPNHRERFHPNHRARERFHPNHRAAADAPLVMACSLTFSAPSGALVAWFE